MNNWKPSELNGTGKAAEREEIPPEQFAQIWQADETIGWIYQYYNDETERKKMREESAAPRNSRELAVRNQFFTPRYVVEFLTDNTLGRIWYEMSGGRTVLKERCRYLVRRPSEVFLAGTAEVYRELFSRNDSADDMTPAKWVAEAFAGQLQNLTENASDPDTRWVGAAIRPADFENLTGEPCQPFEEHRLSRLSSDIIEGRDTADSQNLVLVWASLSDFIRCDGSRGYSAPHWKKVWAHFRKLAQQSVAENLSQADLLKQPVFIPHRALKDPRTILMLDPACGSMHFGIYAFDLFEVIYREAWEFEEKFGADTLIRPSGMKTLHETFATKEEFLRQVPRLIIEHNIHGIDIDPRAAQIAGLALWLRAQRVWKDMGIAPSQRPRITRSNIVCAEPMPGEKELLREFVEKEFPAAERAVFLQLLETIFDKMQLAGEAGSLLKIEEEIRSAIEEARDAWQKLATKPKELFTTTELNQLSTAPELTGLEQALSSLTTDPRHLTTDFWERIEERIYAALRDYAEQAENGGGFQRRLFAEDAARGFAFIDVCRKRYDVALMNPPFGDSVPSVEVQLEKTFSSWCKNLASAFVSMAFERGVEDVRIGVVADRTIIVKSSYEDFRRAIFKRVAGLADLGWEVLDANVEVTTLVLGKPNGSLSVFFDERLIQEKATVLEAQISALRDNFQPDKQTYLLDAASMGSLPNCAFAYDMPASVVAAFEQHDNLVQAGHRALQGHNLSMEQFALLSWEIPSAALAERIFIRMYKGGDYCKFYQPSYEVARWNGDGHHLRGHSGTRWGNEAFQEKPGIGYGKRGDFLDAHILPPNHIFTVEGLAIFPKILNQTWGLLALLNSSACSYILHFYSGQHKMSGYLELFPIPNVPELFSDCEEAAKGIFTVKRQLDGSNELSAEFIAPLGIKSARGTISSAAAHLIQITEDIRQRGSSLDFFVTRAFGLSHAKLLEDSFVASQPLDVASIAFDASSEIVARQQILDGLIHYVLGVAYGRWDIRYATGEQAAPEWPDPFAPLPVCPPGQLQNAQGLPARPEDVPATYPITIQWDGIIADDPTHPVDIERCVREVIEEIWKDRANAIEQEACEILGVNSLRDYFRRPAGFFADHLKRYSKSRRQAPIYWPLATASGSYTLWIYYHRLDDQTLYKCIQQFIDPKLADVEKELTHLRAVLAANEGGAKERKRLEELETLRRELIELRTELELWAPKWKPNLNDGVLITAAPLWKLFRLPKWQKDLKACWQELEKGDYDWSHLSYTLWPDRVREKCKSDRSLAIAHGLENLCDVKAPEKKVKKAKKKAAVELDLEGGAE